MTKNQLQPLGTFAVTVSFKLAKHPQGDENPFLNIVEPSCKVTAEDPEEGTPENVLAKLGLSYAAILVSDAAMRVPADSQDAEASE